MADFSVQITVPNEKVQELVDALNWKWTIDGSGGMTPAQLRANFKTRVEAMLKGIYREHKEWLVSQAVTDDLDVT